MPTFGEQIQEVMKERNLTARALAKTSGVPYFTIIRISNGTHSKPSWPAAKRLAKALILSLDEMAEREDE